MSGKRAAAEGDCKPGLFGLDRNVFILGLVSFFNDLSSEMAYPLLPLFLTETLGAGALFLGLVEGLADFIASLLQIFSGWISDHVRKRKGLAVGGYSLSGVSRGFLALATGPWQVLVAWFFNRVGKGIRSPRCPHRRQLLAAGARSFLRLPPGYGSHGGAVRSSHRIHSDRRGDH